MKTIKIYLDQINRHLIRTRDDSGHVVSEKWEENGKEDCFCDKAEFTGWLNYMRANSGHEGLWEKHNFSGKCTELINMMQPFDGKKIRITVETIE